MKIGITCYPTVGGSGVVASELGHALARRGHEIHFICYAPPFRMRSDANLVFHPIEIPRYPLFEYPSYGMAAAAKMAQIARAYRLDLLHVHYAYPHGVSAWLAKQIIGGSALKTVVTLHGTDISLVGQDETFYMLTRFALEGCDAVTAVSRYLMRKTQAWFGKERNIRVIPNFVDTERFSPRPDGEESEGLGSREPVIVHVSNFRPVKRSMDMIRIFARIRSRLPARLWMIGDGPEREDAQTLAHALGVHGAVDFLGDARDMEQRLPRADLLVSTSESEGFGLAPLEAMSCGVPVVATRSGGLPELITDGEDGLLCPVGNVEDISEKCIRLLTSADLHARLRRNGRRKAVSRYGLSRIVPVYEAMYEDLLSAPAPVREGR